VLNTGSTAPEAAHFTGDPFLTQVQQAAAAQRAEVARFGTYAQTHEAVPGAMWRFARATAGRSSSRRCAGPVRSPRGRERGDVAGGRAGRDRRGAGLVLHVHRGELLLFSVPPAGKGRITLVAASDGLISATAH